MGENNVETNDMTESASPQTAEHVTYTSVLLTRPTATPEERGANFARLTRSLGIEPEDW